MVQNARFLLAKKQGLQLTPFRSDGSSSDRPCSQSFHRDDEVVVLPPLGTPNQPNRRYIRSSLALAAVIHIRPHIRSRSRRLFYHPGTISLSATTGSFSHQFDFSMSPGYPLGHHAVQTCRLGQRRSLPRLDASGLRPSEVMPMSSLRFRRPICLRNILTGLCIFRPRFLVAWQPRRYGRKMIFGSHVSRRREFGVTFMVTPPSRPSHSQDSSRCPESLAGRDDISQFPGLFVTAAAQGAAALPVALLRLSFVVGLPAATAVAGRTIWPCQDCSISCRW